MNYFILLFGALIALSGAVLLIRPDTIFGVLRRYADSIGLRLFAIIVRITLGVVLVIGASASRFPVVLQILGWLSISAALVLVVIGRVRFQNLIKWSLGLAPAFTGLAGLLAVLFGGFLIYAVL